MYLKQLIHYQCQHADTPQYFLHEIHYFVPCIYATKQVEGFLKFFVPSYFSQKSILKLTQHSNSILADATQRQPGWAMPSLGQVKNSQEQLDKTLLSNSPVCINTAPPSLSPLLEHTSLNRTPSILTVPLVPISACWIAHRDLGLCFGKWTQKSPTQLTGSASTFVL